MFTSQVKMGLLIILNKNSPKIGKNFGEKISLLNFSLVAVKVLFNF